MMVSVEELKELIRFLPLDTIDFAFAYGSGVVAQHNRQAGDRMIDFVLSSTDSLRFHHQNLEYNRHHYSNVRYLGPVKLVNMQRNFAARVYYNTYIRHEGKLMKYGIVETEDLKRDLLDWRWLYLAGRLQKAMVNVIAPSSILADALKENRKSAAQAALLQMPDSFTLDNFYTTVVSLSYTGDFRMTLGEDKMKIQNIVNGSREELSNIFLPILREDPRLNIRELQVDQDTSNAAIYHRVQLLPCTVLEQLQKASCKRDHKHRDIEEVSYSLAHRLDVARHIRHAISCIVAQSALSQTFKNVLTAGFRKSTLYAFSKVLKMFKSMAR